MNKHTRRGGKKHKPVVVTPFHYQCKRQAESLGFYVLWNGAWNEKWTVYDRETGRELLVFDYQKFHVWIGGVRQPDRAWREVLPLAQRRREAVKQSLANEVSA